MRRFLAFGLLSIALTLWLSNLVYPARSFNGSTDIISISGSGTAIDLVNHTMSISAWFYRTVDALQCVVCKWDENSKKQYLLELQSNGRVTGALGTGSSDLCVDTTITQSSQNTWTHAAYTVDPAAGGLAYINGVPAGGSASCSTASVSNGESLLIGAGFNSSPTLYRQFTGKIGEVAIWDVRLTTSEVAAMAAGVPANKIRPTSLKLYQPLMGIASPESDFSGFQLVGTLTGTAQASHCPCGKPAGAEGPTH